MISNKGSIQNINEKGYCAMKFSSSKYCFAKEEYPPNRLSINK